MDHTQEELFSVDLSQDTVDFANVTIGSGSGINTTYTLSNLDLTASSISISQPWVTTTNGTGGLTWANVSDPAMTVQESGRLQLKGKNADIEINGESLMDMIRGIEQRLNIMRPNQELEAEWDQLRELGEQYRNLEKKQQEQSDM